jgi:large subunit ribosomal protein L22
MEIEAQARFMRIAPRKARLVADTVVGLPVKEALVVLQFTPRAAAIEVAKVLKSAAANASNNFSQDEDALVVKRIQVNPGPTLKRGRARARGMYFSIFKRTCHITAVVEAVEPEVRPRRRRPEPSETAPAPAPARKKSTRSAAKPKTVPKAKAAEPAEVPAAEQERAVEAEADAGTQAADSTEPSEETKETS